MNTSFGVNLRDRTSNASTKPSSVANSSSVYPYSLVDVFAIPVVDRYPFLKVNTDSNSGSWRTIISWIAFCKLSVLLVWTKYLAKSFPDSSKSMKLSFTFSLFVNCLLTSSITRTLFVLQITLSTKLLFLNSRNFDEFLFSINWTSASLAWANPKIVSTLDSSIISVNIRDFTVVTATPTFVRVAIPTSTKFFKPVVWTKRLITSIESWYWIGLLTEYDKFW